MTIEPTASPTLLSEYEAVIERGVATFIEVGNALASIRDGRLYRETHATFEAYCRERWDFSRQRASQLILAADLSTTVDIANEGQARRLREPAPTAGWREFDQDVKALRHLARVEPKVVAMVVPPRRRLATARVLRRLGTYLGHVALELEGLE